MYLNILEYIDDDKQEKLLEIIDMAEKVKGLIQSIKDESLAEGKAEGNVKGMKKIIDRILDIHSVEEAAELLRMDESEILHIINM